MDQKGMGIQFNWIFVIIAGAVILGFFTMFVFKYIDFQETKEDLQISRTITDIMFELNGAPFGEGSVLTSFSGHTRFAGGQYANVKYACEQGESYFIVDDEPLSKQELNDEMVFGPKEMYINSYEAIIFPWSHPFFISNMIYLVYPDEHIYFIADTSSEDYVRELFLYKNAAARASVDAELVSSSTEVKGNSLRVAWISQSLPEISTVKAMEKNKATLHLVHFNPKTNKVTFYEKGKWSESKEVIGEAMFYGALFVDDLDTYACLNERALGRLEAVTRVLNAKLDLLSRDNAAQGCVAVYASMRMKLDALLSGSYFVNKDIEQANEDMFDGGCGSLY